MNIKEHKDLLEKALCTLELLEQAKTVRFNLHQWKHKHGHKFPGLLPKNEHRTRIYEDRVIPRLEMRYRNQIHQATQAQ